MTLAGGSADKYGNLYEACWTVKCLLDVMDERYDTIRLEDPRPVGEGFEFWVRRDDTVEYHQVKSSGSWTMRKLGNEDVIRNFSRNLSESSVHCVFSSPKGADDLDIVSQRARNSTDWDEFRTASIFTKQVEKAFGAYRQFAGGVPEREAYDQLSRIWVNSSGYRNLRDQIEDHAFYIVDGESAGVVETLAQFGLESAVRNAELNALDIWNHLESIGYKRRHWDTDPRVLSSVQEANRRYIDSFKRQSIHGNSMPRDEVSTAEGLLTSAKESVSVLVTGEAGVGKSGVMFQVVEGLMAAGFPVLALRADWLNSTQLADDVGAQCGLLGSPPRVLAAVAQKKSCVLVIDQLDAVSMASGRNSALYECMNDILLQALSYDNMNILLACRKFDLDHDNRLRRLASQGTDSTTVTVNRLSEERVLEVVKSLGIDADRLTEGQLSLLSVPLHLWLLSDLVQDEEVSALNFESANDLYERFWLFKQRILGERLGRQIHWTQVIGTLCDYMHEYQVLTAPQDLVDEWDADATAMSSENVLVLDGLRYSFFHEGFFDYCYARSFSRRGESLLGLLTQDEQGLFRRAQVRQILLYLREADFDRYAGDLRDVLHSDDVRFHIKQAVLAVLSGLSEPSEREWEVLSEFRMEDYSNPASRQVWAIIRRSGSWFRLVDSLGLVEQWLESTDEEFVDRAVWLLSGAQPRDSDRVTALLTPRVGGSERWNSRLQELARSTDWTAGRPYFDLMISLIDQGVLDDVDGSQASIAGLSSFLGYWSKSKPAWGCEVIGHYLARRRELSVQAGEPNPFDLSSGTVPLHDFPRDIISVCADGAPQAFVCEVLPFVQKTVEDTAGGELEGLRLDKVWSRRAFPEGYNAASTLLGALASALSVLAVQEPDEFKNLIGPLLQSEFETLQYLVIRGMASNGEQFADEGLMHLCERPERFNVGSLSDRRWTVRRLIEAAGPYASSDPLRGLEKELLEFYPEWERSDDGEAMRGAAQYLLLDGVPEDLRSQGVILRLGELARKFPTDFLSPPRNRAQRVGPPIQEAVAATMTDDDWLRGLARYCEEERNWGPGGPEGGAWELSQVLEREVERDPRRFANLVTLFPDEIHPLYFKAVLRGLQGTDLDVETVATVCERCQRIPGHGAGAEIADLVAAQGEVDVPMEMLDIVSWNGIEHLDPEEEKWRIAGPGTGEFLFDGDPFAHGINTVRGRAARAMAQLLRTEPGRLEQLESALERMVADSSVAVRSCVAEVLTVALSIDRAKAIGLFRNLCDTDDALLKTPYVERFLWFTLVDHFNELLEMLERMIHSPLHDVSTTGAKLACLTALDLPDAVRLADVCLKGTESQRLGAAEIMSANVTLDAYRSACEEPLAGLFDDQSEEVRAASCRWLDDLEGAGLADLSSLASRLVESEAFAGNYFHLFRALEMSSDTLPEVTLSACERFVGEAGISASDVSIRNAGEATHVITLVLRVYREMSDNNTRARCLDLVDRLMEIGAFGVERALEDYER